MRGRERETYSMPESSDVACLVEAFDADGFVEGEGQLEEASDPAGELFDVVVALAPAEVDYSLTE